jgi:formylglycine-generating enzyme required for sulfatase activity
VNTEYSAGPGSLKLILCGIFLCSIFFCLIPQRAFAAEQVYANSIGMEFVPIPAGSFVMGSDKGKDKEAGDDEIPQHQVTISKPFYLGRYEVTQAQWEAMMGNNPSKFQGRNNPVENVSWEDAQEFIKRLNAREGTNAYRLPTEAEWEYAARAGTTGIYSFGDDEASLGRHAWYDDNSDEKSHPVGQKAPNAWGLYDMHGNVYEWVQDWYDGFYYYKTPSENPRGLFIGLIRVNRGGAWVHGAWGCRSAFRGNNSPDRRRSDIGFRLALSPE